ncbi:hypothetical protein NDU88_002043 [Pleurodeles waltl]|uniref:Uncharacterized protein n=1 Tax=Pleurodeles waltl TaxID=8319 RepID=A0AAV7QBT3_PLEWA|nr:hypothetical protein NDU88_002043 [Pleurodeles waltl]
MPPFILLNPTAVRVEGARQRCGEMPGERVISLLWTSLPGHTKDQAIRRRRGLQDKMSRRRLDRMAEDLLQP